MAVGSGSEEKAGRQWSHRSEGWLYPWLMLERAPSLLQDGGSWAPPILTWVILYLYSDKANYLTGNL